MQDATIVQVVTGVDWPAVAAAIAGGVVGVAGIVAAVWQARRAADAARLDARNREIAAVATAARQLQDAVRLYRSLTAGRRTSLAGLATGIDIAGRYVLEDGTMPGLIVHAIASARDVLKLGGLYDQVQITGGESYQQVVTPPLERLTDAAETVRVNQSGQLRAAAAEVLRCGGILAAKGDAGKREYKRAETDFQQALSDFQDAS